MAALRGVVCGGICADEVYARIGRAGVDPALVEKQTDYEALAALAAESDVPVFFLPSYTGMMEFRPYLTKRTGGKDFWE